MRSTPLIDIHIQLGANIGEFAGVKTVFDFGNALEEHVATRNVATVFDISHMGRIQVKGADAYKLLNKLVSKDLAKSKKGYMFGPTAFLNEHGGFKDDVMIYVLSDSEYLIVTNAVNREKILSWLEYWSRELDLKDIEINDYTEVYAMIAIQGPKSSEYLSKLGLALSSLKKLEFITNVHFNNHVLTIVSRSGWTGENGFEVIAPPDALKKLFVSLVNIGVKPAGLIARDSLRIEMGYCLYGNEISEDITPIEARYWVFEYDKKDYIGAEKIVEKIRNGVERIRLGIRMKKGVRFIPRHGYRVYVAEGVEVGFITSGTYSPILERGIAQAYIASRYAIPGLKVYVDIRGRLVEGRLTDFPFIQR